MSDGCGMYGEYFSCVDSTSQNDSYIGFTHEQHGESSFCFDSTMSQNVVVPAIYQSRCYPYVCGTSNITITIGGFSVECLSTEGGTVKTLSGLQGSLTCPDFTRFCTVSRKTCSEFCNQNGYCMGGVCNCLTTAFGSDCTQSSCTAGQFYSSTTSTCVSTCPSGTYANIFSHTC